MTLRYAAKRPTEDLDGMQQHEDDFLQIADPQDIVAVVIVQRHQFIGETGQPRRASLKIKHIEPLEGDAVEAARKLLASAYSARTGNEQLPIDDEEQPTLALVEGGDDE